MAKYEEKVFNIDGTEYAVKICTAICGADLGDEGKRQDALLVSSERDGEMFNDVVFGYEMPDTEENFLDICADYAAWESVGEVKMRSALDYVRKV